MSERPPLLRDPDQWAARIRNELEDRQFYGLANSRIEWLLTERERLIAENHALATTVERIDMYVSQGRFGGIRQHLEQCRGKS